MITGLKKIFYFPVAKYFLFFAGVRLARWRPTIIVVTGSNGKTTLLHILESQLREKARYSHRANGAYGIAFHILDLKRETLFKKEWVGLFFLAPIHALLRPPEEKLYVVEVDCDRPEEGRIVASFLRPDIVLWLSVSRTHTVNFDRLISSNGSLASERGIASSTRLSSRRAHGFQPFRSRNDIFVDEAVASEFGYLLEYCKRLAVVNGDNPLILKQLRRTRANVVKVEKQKWLESYLLQDGKTEFVMKGKRYILPFLLPEETFYAIAMCAEALGYLGIRSDMDFASFVLPPGRSSVFKGVKGTTIIDSTYNATPASVAAILSMFRKYKAGKKWIVLADMVELGDEEQEEHEKLAELINKADAERILLMGPRMVKYTYPKLSKKFEIRNPRSETNSNDQNSNVQIIKFLTPKEVLEYLQENLEGREVILFKGARFLEGVIEHLLQNKSDIAKLSRREKAWERRRREWGL